MSTLAMTSFCVRHCQDVCGLVWKICIISGKPPLPSLLALRWDVSVIFPTADQTVCWTNTEPLMKLHSWNIISSLSLWFFGGKLQHRLLNNDVIFLQSLVMWWEEGVRIISSHLPSHVRVSGPNQCIFLSDY